MNKIKNLKIKELLQITLVIGLGVFLLCMLQMYNQFPLLMGDTLGYLRRAFYLNETNHWSNTYTFFIYNIYDAFGTIQMITVVQNIMTAIVMYAFLIRVLPEFKNWKYLLIIFFLLFSTLPWTSTLLMTDIFTPLSMLILILFIEKKLSKVEWIGLSLILFITLSSHQSHLMILPLFAFVVMLKNLISRKNYKALFKRIGFIGLLFIVSNIFEQNILRKQEHTPPNMGAVKTVEPDKLTKLDEPLPSNKIYYAHNTVVPGQPIPPNVRVVQIIPTHQKKPVPPKKPVLLEKPSSKTSGVHSGYYFMAIRMHESNQLDMLLEGFCKNAKSNYLCSDIPTPEGEIRVKNVKIHQRHDDNPEYIKFGNDNKAFVLYALMKPRFYYGIMTLVFRKGLQLFTNIRTGYFKTTVTHNKKMTRILDQNSPGDMNAYELSKQKSGFDKTNAINVYDAVGIFWWYVLFPGILILMPIIGIAYKLKKITIKHSEIIWTSLFLVYGHFVNTMVCGTFSNYKNLRYSIKTLWLVNLALILLVFWVLYFVKQKRENQNEVNSTNSML